MSAVEKFPILLSEAEEESSAVPPCFSDEGINVSYIQEYIETRLTPLAVSLYQTFESLPTRSYQAQHQCRRDSSIPA